MNPANRQQGKRETRDRILDAALELFSTEGYEAATVKRIAERCGLSDAAIYYYFQSKQEILTTLMEERWNIPRGLQQLSRIVAAPMTPELLDRVADNILDALARNEPIIRIIVRQCLALDPLALQLRATRREAWEKGLLQQFDERFGVEDAEMLVDVLLAVSISLFLSARSEHGRDFADLVRDEEYRARARRIIRRNLPLERLAGRSSEAS